MIKGGRKIVVFSVIGGLSFWIIDTVIDAVVFAHGTFWGSLLGGLTAHELYSRSFVLVSFVSFGVFISRALAKQKEAEEQVEESEKKYKNLVELTTDIIYVSDKDGNQAFMNDAAFKALGYSPKEVIGKPVLNLIHPEDREKTWKKRMEMIEQNIDVFNFENRYITKSGKSITVLHNVRVLRDEKGRIAGTQGIARDITELKKAEEAVEERERQQEAILNNIPDIAWLKDRGSRFIAVNEPFGKACGVDPEKLVGKTDFDIWPKELAERYRADDREVMETGARKQVEEPLVDKEGRRTWIETIKTPIFNDRGEVIGTTGIARDITRRKTAEEKLKLFSEAMEEAMDGVQVVDLDGKVIYSNKAVEEIYGFTADELSGKHVNDMNVDRELANSVILPSIREKGRWSGEFMVVHKSGREFPIWLSTSLVKNDRGEPIAMVGIIRDITERRRIENELRKHREHLMELVRDRTIELTRMNDQLQHEIIQRRKMEEDLVRAQKLESIGILAGGIAHDFNNLLAAMMGNISLAMLDIPHDHPAYRQLSGAERAALRAQDLTQQLLTFSKGGAPVKAVTSIGTIIKEAAGFALHGTDVKCEFSVPDDLWSVEVDEGQMTQVFNNMLINADQAMPSGGVISISCENINLGANDVVPLTQGEYVKISVQDYGIGIPKEHIPKIFDPYFTTKQRGSGLGLATAYSIVNKHDGFIAVESELGAGTIFHLYLPASREKEMPERAEKRRLPVGGGRILVMDDEEGVRQTTGDMLRRLGYEVGLAEDGVQAVAAYQKAMQSGEPFDAVIMDLTIPGGAGGKEAVKKLLEIDPNAKAIVSSGYSQDPVMAAYQEYGFKGVASKPYRIRELGEVVNKVLNNSS